MNKSEKCIFRSYFVFCIADVIIYISSYDVLLGEAPSIGPLVKKAVLLLLILYSSVQDDIYFGNF